MPVGAVGGGGSPSPCHRVLPSESAELRGRYGRAILHDGREGGERYTLGLIGVVPQLLHHHVRRGKVLLSRVGALRDLVRGGVWTGHAME